MSRSVPRPQIPGVVVATLAVLAVLLAVASESTPLRAAGPVVAATPSVAPTAGATADAVDECVGCQPATLTPTTDLNVRRGPGTDYAVVGYLRTGQVAAVSGINADGSWLQIAYPAAPDGQGWVARRYVETSGDLAAVPVVSVPAPAPSPTPTASPAPTPAPTETAVPPAAAVEGWHAEYFDNLSLQGAPFLVRIDPVLDFNWADRAPAPGLPADDFSARWTRTADFRDDTYHFTIEADDGVRLWLDDRLIIDEWHDTRPTTYAADVEINEGSHRLRIEYYEHTASAMVRLTWRRPAAWRARYFGNTKLDDDPLLERWEEEIDYDWGSGAPDPAVPADNFSARWTADVTFDDDVYVFNVEADDGVRLWAGNELLIDSWTEGVRTLRAEKRFDQRSKYTVRVEYYERWGNARIRLSWDQR